MWNAGYIAVPANFFSATNEEGMWVSLLRAAEAGSAMNQQAKSTCPYRADINIPSPIAIGDPIFAFWISVNMGKARALSDNTIGFVLRSDDDYPILNPW